MLALTLAVPAFALEESDVEAAVSSSSREAVAGNVLVWFLCAVGFLKVSQKIDSFMASIGVNVGHTGGSMLGEAMVAFKGVSLAAGTVGKAVGGFTDKARAGGKTTSGSSGFLQGGLAGVVSRKITNDAVRTATQTTQKASSSTASAAYQATKRTVNAERQAASVVHQSKQTNAARTAQSTAHQQTVSSLHRESQHSVGLGGRLFANSLLEGGRFANDVIGMVAAGDLHSTGSITGEFASQALSSYMGITAQGDAAPQISYSDIEIGGGRITGTEYSPEHPEGISFGMYHTGQYAAPDGEHQKVFSADGVQWYKQYAADTVIKTPFTAPDGEIDYHIAILGTSGAGKTFTLQLMALRMRRKGIQVFIIAPLKGHEFHRACSNIGGQFISISPASQNCINIMEIRKADKSVDDLLDGPGTEKSLLAAKIQRLHTFFSLLIPDMSHEERQLLDDAMICTYGTKGITHDNASLEQPKNPGCYKEMPILGDLYEILAASPETKRLANILNRLVNGSARSFNQQTNVALDNKYIVLDISELTGDLLTVGMFVALDFVWDKAKENRTAEKAIFVDECWQLIGASSNRQAAESVLELAKTIRGYGGSLVCATQDLNDFFALDDGKYGKGIINNSKTKILLNLEEEEAQRVQGVLHLSEAELMEITHFERGSALISTNNNNIAVEIKCSQMEKELITTDRRELAELAQRAAPKQHPC